MNSKKIFLTIITVIVIIAIAVILIGGYFLWQKQKEPQKEYTGSVETVRIALTKSVPELSSLIWIADANGYFKDEGLNIIITQETNGVVAQEKVASGDADIAVDSDFGFVGDSFTMDNLKILASIDDAKIIDILARRDKGISVPADLKGKKIGVTPKLTTEFFFYQFLIANDILPSQVTIISMPLADQQKALLTGEVDAVSTTDPYTSSIKNALGANGIDWPAQGVQTIPWLVISSDQFLGSHPETIVRFLKSVVTAENFLKANPEKAKQVIIKRLAEDPNYFNNNWSKHNFNIALSQSLLITMESEARFKIASKLTDKAIIPNYLNFIYFDALDKVKPDAVTIIH